MRLKGPEKYVPWTRSTRPQRALQAKSHRRRGELTFSVRVVKYCKNLTVYVATAPSVNNFKKMLETRWTEVFPYLPH